MAHLNLKKKILAYLTENSREDMIIHVHSERSVDDNKEVDDIASNTSRLKIRFEYFGLPYRTHPIDVCIYYNEKLVCFIDIDTRRSHRRRSQLKECLYSSCYPDVKYFKLSLNHYYNTDEIIDLEIKALCDEILALSESTGR